MFTPPMKPTRPSTTISLRWSRRCSARRGRLPRRVDLADVDAAFAQAVEVAVGRGDRAEAVVEHVHPHAGLGALHQPARELLARTLGLEDVALEVDVQPGLVDGLEHGLVGLRA